MQIKFDVLCENSEAMEAALYHMPLFQHHLTERLARLDQYKLKSYDSRNYLKKTIISTMNELLEQETGKGGVVEIYIVELIIE